MAYTPFPPANISVTGTLSANDAVVAAPIGDGSILSGASTAGSLVAVAVPSGYTSWTLLIKGYTSGTIYTEASFNSTNGTDGDWVEVKGRRTGTAVGVESVIYAMVANGYYRGNGSGFTYLRARLIGGGTGATVTWQLSQSMGATFLNSGIPSGSSLIGNVGLTLSNVSMGARPDGYARMMMDPTTLLFDTFETVDTTNTWTLGGTALPTGANGILTVSANATASATSYAVSKPTFIPGSNAYLLSSDLVTVDATASTGTNRFWGLGVISGPTVTVPITNGCVFEIDTTGAFYGSVYSAGARTQTVALTKPVDGLVHRYSIYYKSSRAYFEIDNVSVGSIPFPNPTVAALSAVIGQINSGTVTGTNTLTATLIGVADSGRNATKLADGLYPWRTGVFKPGGAAVAADNALVVTMHPSGAGQFQPYGWAKVSPEPITMFYDPFDLAIDTVVRWTTAGSAPPSTTNGNTVLATGTTASATSYLTSQPTFNAISPGYMQTSWLARFDANGPAVTQAYRFMGMGNAPATPTQAAPLIDGYGFVIDVDGKMYFDVWASSVRVSRTDLSVTGTGTAQSKQPLDGQIHRYLVQFRTERIYVFIDGNDVPIISLANAAPNIQTLPVKFMQINGATQTTAPTFQVSSVAVADTGRNANAISDGAFGWRKATVKAASTTPVATDTPLVVALHPNSAVQSVSNLDTVVTGSITINDTLAGGPAATTFTNISPSAGSTVAVQNTTGATSWTMQVTGVYTGTIYVEQSQDSTTGLDGNWTTATSRQVGGLSGFLTSGLSGIGVLQGSTAGFRWIRARSYGAQTGTANINFRLSSGVDSVFLAASLPPGTNSIGTVQQAALTKGTQNATGVSTQDLKDSGRTSFAAATVIAGVTAVTTEALVTMTPVRAGVAGTAASSFAVTANKRLRLVALDVGFISTAAAVLSMRFVLRHNPTGAVTTASPILMILPLSSGAALAQAGNQISIALPDGIEFSGTDQFGISMIGSAATGTAWVTAKGFEY